MKTKTRYSKEDTGIKGDHYKAPIQVIDFIEANNLNFSQGNVVKYVTRYKKKDGKIDLEKALYYINRLIQE